VIKLITILLMHVGEAGTYAAQFDSQMACGEALVAFAAIADELEAEYGEVWARCLVTGAPSVSLRPQARPIEV
jgi:hypothetical protein